MIGIYGYSGLHLCIFLKTPPTKGTYSRSGMMLNICNIMKDAVPEDCEFETSLGNLVSPRPVYTAQWDPVLNIQTS